MMVDWWGEWTDHDYYVLGAILMLVLCSLLTRCGYAVLGDYLPLSDGVRRALRYAPAAALVAIIVPEVLPWQAGEWPRVDLRFFALLVGALVFLRLRSTVGLILSGMATYWGLMFLVR